MTDLYEFEEAEPIESSHLVRTGCMKCGTPLAARCVPERVRTARCGACILKDSGADGRTHGKVGPVIRYGTFALTPPEEVIAEYPTPTYLGPVFAVSGEPLVMQGEPVPTSVMKLAEYAREQSWEVRAQYTRGCFPHATTGRPGAEQHVISLRFGGHPMTDRQAYAIHSRAVAGDGAWTWKSVAVWGPDLPPYLGLGITGLEAFLDEPARATEIIAARIVDLKLAAAAKALEADVRKEIKAKHQTAMSRPLDSRFATRAAFEDVLITALCDQYGRSRDEIVKIVTKRSGKEREHA